MVAEKSPSKKRVPGSIRQGPGLSEAGNSPEVGLIGGEVSMGSDHSVEDPQEILIAWEEFIVSFCRLIRARQESKKGGLHETVLISRSEALAVTSSPGWEEGYTEGVLLTKQRWEDSYYQMWLQLIPAEERDAME